MACSSDTGLHFVAEKQDILLVAQLPQAGEEVRVGGNDSAFTLYGFDQNRGGLVSDGGLYGVEVVEFSVDKAGGQGGEAFLHFLLSGGGQRGERPAMEGVFHGDDFKLSFV